MLNGYVNLPNGLESALASVTPEISGEGRIFTYTIEDGSLFEELRKIILSNKTPVADIKISIDVDAPSLLIKGALVCLRDIGSGYTIATMNTGLLAFGITLLDETPEYISVVINLLGEM